MNDRQQHLNTLTSILREEPESVPYILGYLSAYLPTANLHNAIESYAAHTIAVESMQATLRLAAANEQIAQE